MRGGDEGIANIKPQAKAKKRLTKRAIVLSVVSFAILLLAFAYAAFINTEDVPIDNRYGGSDAVLLAQAAWEFTHPAATRDSMPLQLENPTNTPVPPSPIPLPPIGIDNDAIKQEMLTVAENCRDLFLTFDSYETIDDTIFIPTYEQKKDLLTRIGEMGYPAADSDMDMMNAEQVHDFYSAYESKTDAQIGIYTYKYGQLSRLTFLLKDGLLYSAVSTLKWDSEMQPAFTPIGEMYVSDVFMMSPKGYLFYGWGKESTLKYRAVSGIRVEPLGEENRRLCRTYIEPLMSYAYTNILSQDWDASCIERINFNDVFEALYHNEYGVWPDTVYQDSYIHDKPFIKAIPANDFETVISKYFQIGPERLRQFAVYDQDKDAYAFEAMMLPDASPDWEVVDYTHNDDGSLTIIVDAVSPPHLMDCVVKNTVTVLPKDDGSYQYLSNQLVRFDEGIESRVPTFQEYSPRIRK